MNTNSIKEDERIELDIHNYKRIQWNTKGFTLIEPIDLIHL